MSLEHEIKFAATSTQIAQLRTHPAIKPFYTKKILVTTLYFDTPDFLLHHQKTALRLRTIEKRQYYLEIKLAKASQENIQIREEISLPLSSPVLDRQQIPPEIKKHWGNADNLTPIFTTDFRREIWDIFSSDRAHIELVLDLGEITSCLSQHTKCSNKSKKISEVELELKSGTLADLSQFASWFESTFHLTPQSRSKAEQGYALIQKSTQT